MKKLMRSFCMMGAVALLLTSCNKNKETEKSFVAVGQTYEVEAGEFDGQGAEKLHFHIGRQVFFDEGDRVILFNLKDNGGAPAYAYYTAANSAQSDVVTFSPEGADLGTEGTFYAYYPADQVDPSDLNYGNVTFVIPTEQTYQEYPDEGLSMPTNGFFMAAKNESYKNTFYFYNIGGLLKLNLWASTATTVGKIVLTNYATDGLQITGNVTCKIDAIDYNILLDAFNNYDPTNNEYMENLNNYLHGQAGYNAYNTGDVITLVCNKEISTDKNNSTPFFIGLRPAALKYGFKVQVYDNNDVLLKTMESTKVDVNMIRPNVIKSMPNFKVR